MSVCRNSIGICSPRAGSERHGLDELLGGTGVVPGSDAFDHGADPLSTSSTRGAKAGSSAEQRE